MGEQRVRACRDAAERRRMTLRLLDDLDALERMLRLGAFETGVRRIGVEQELFLVDDAWRPAPVALELLELLAEERFTAEIGRHLLEINFEPLPLGAGTFARMENDLAGALARVDEAARQRSVRPLLIGILPTLRKSDLTLENMTPWPRYRALDAAMNELRRGPWRLYVQGFDEIACHHDNIMLESCCASFQVHLQVDPDEFAHLYNLTQAVTAPVLAAAANAAILFGRRLWHETRIPLFQQSFDARVAGDSLRESSARVRFGDGWVNESILELLREDAMRFRILLATDIREDPHALLAAGRVPELWALRLLNGTVYRWNRGCYGVYEGRPHLRIEMRALPAGPTVADEVGNAALFVGSVLGLRDRIPDVRAALRFSQAASNFQAAAKLGLDARLNWWHGRRYNARELVLEELLPAAQEGLRSAGVTDEEIDRTLGVVDERVRARRTGALWALGSYTRLTGRATRQQIATAITASTYANQQRGVPGHLWDWATLPEVSAMHAARLRVEEIMSTDLYTVGPDEPAELAAKMMAWRGVKHVPVERPGSRLVGLLTSTDLLAYLARRGHERERATVAEIMTPAPVTVSPEAPVAMALRLMRERGVECLPVIVGGRLVGLVTEHDFIELVGRLLEQPRGARLASPPPAPAAAAPNTPEEAAAPAGHDAAEAPARQHARSRRARGGRSSPAGARSRHGILRGPEAD